MCASQQSITPSKDSIILLKVKISLVTVAAQTKAIKAERRIFSHWLCQATLQNRSLIILDEFGFKLSQRICNGRSEKGERATASTLGIKTKNISIMAAMTKNG